MRIVACLVVLVLAACPNNKAAPDAAKATADAPLNACTGAVYDPCTGDNTKCMSMDCKLYTAAGLMVCTTACSASVPCPNDSSGATVACNGMGNCKPSVANSCAPQ